MPDDLRHLGCRRGVAAALGPHDARRVRLNQRVSASSHYRNSKKWTSATSPACSGNKTDTSNLRGLYKYIKRARHDSAMNSASNVPSPLDERVPSANA